MAKQRPLRTAASRFVVGIDLGTTNSVVAFADATAAPDSAPIELLSVPQVIAPGSVEPRPLLPSFLYLPAVDEFAPGALQLPWPSDSAFVVGAFARKRGIEMPARLVASAKSWLSYAGADRNAAILPWGGPDEVSKLSPVAASALYLQHLRQAWDARFADAPLGEQEVFLTVPASFDAAARELTVRAAGDAGLPRVTLLEEPQAAFYAWIEANAATWRQDVRMGDLVVVCDVGGGTTDFSLIAVREAHGELHLERVAVGDHILLGGDNMDLALAYRVRDRLAGQGTVLDAWQFRSLMLGCREAKEQLLNATPDTVLPLAILGRGRRVVGSSVRVEISGNEVDAALLDGFFPRCALHAQPQAQRRTALQEIGLPYASDPAVTRHLAYFLSRQEAALGGAGAAAAPQRPTAVLFNGGVMRAAALRHRLLDVLNSWFTGGPAVRALTGGDPEHAVARGAAYYGLARRGRGVRIRGGTARAYYVGIETAMPAVPGMRPPIKALCVVPYGLEEGSEVDLPQQEFGLVVGAPAEFRFLGSATRRSDEVGSLIDAWDDDIQELAPLQTMLKWRGQEGTTVPVKLQARLSEVGVLELWCVARDGQHRWKLEFNVRAAD